MKYGLANVLLMFFLVGCTNPRAVGPDFAAELHSRGVWSACRDGDVSWYEMPYSARVYNGRPLTEAGSAIANAFVCRGFMRLDGAVAPSEDIQWLVWSAIADAERRATAIVLTPRYPVSSPIRICSGFYDLLNNTLQRKLAPSPSRLFFALQSAFAELAGGERWMEDPGLTFHSPSRTAGLPWLGPTEPLAQCEWAPRPATVIR